MSAASASQAISLAPSAYEVLDQKDDTAHLRQP
jgi:hypothetical protein